MSPNVPEIPPPTRLGSLPLAELAADKVMGWTYVVGDVWVCKEPWKVIHVGTDWNPRDSEADCWMLVDKLLADGSRHFSLYWGDGKWDATFSFEAPDSVPGDRVWTEVQASDADRLLAIMLACLRLVDPGLVALEEK